MSEDHAFYWRTLLGPAITEELIQQAYDDIEADKAQRRRVRKDNGSKKTVNVRATTTCTN